MAQFHDPGAQNEIAAVARHNLAPVSRAELRKFQREISTKCAGEPDHVPAPARAMLEALLASDFLEVPCLSVAGTRGRVGNMRSELNTRSKQLFGFKDQGNFWIAFCQYNRYTNDENPLIVVVWTFGFNAPPLTKIRYTPRTPEHTPQGSEVFSQLRRASRLVEKADAIRSLLGRRILLSAGAALVNLHREEHKPGFGQTKDSYKDLVFQQLFGRGSPFEIVLALCGKKGMDEPEARAYFMHFITFALEHDARMVCRIFALPDSGEFDDATKAHLELHRRPLEDGILGLTLPAADRDELENKYAGVCECLEQGYGFLIFLGPCRPLAIVHAGGDENLAYGLIRDQHTIIELLELFGELAKSSKEYKQNPDTTTWINNLLCRLNVPQMWPAGERKPNDNCAK